MNRDIDSYRPRGVVVAVVTPFRDDESLDETRLQDHLSFLLDAGVDAVMPLGGSGEYVNLSMAERKRVIDASVSAVAHRVPVIIGALSPSTREVIEVGEYAMRAGADGLLALPPYYIRPSQAGMVDHFARIVAETGLPVIAYNNPPRAGWAIALEALEEIAAIPGVIGLKDCDRDVAAIAVKIERLGQRLTVLSGDDDLEFATLLSGAAGGIWATANLAPRLCIALYDACVRGDLTEARRLQSMVLALVNVRKLPNHPGPLKEMMAMVGRSVGPARRPLFPMTEGQRTAVKELLDSLQPLSEELGMSAPAPAR
jgi:4-hydroxy-tetrahydrodipicolinate synthase